jgi:hypothetical protein
MATKKDLVEAYSFSRRRLVTAFVSGAPGGREVEPVRPGRVLIGGVALSVLLLAGAAIAGFLIGRPPAQWLEQGSFIISKDTGEQYVVMRGGDDPVLQRVPNYISAQLLLAESNLTPHTVRDKYIRAVRLGEDLGIEGAPAGLPDPEALVSDGWTACTDPGSGVKVAIQSRPEVEELQGASFLVRSGKKLWLIAPSPGVAGEAGRAYRFQMPADAQMVGAISDALGFDASPATIDREWLNLFPAGAPLSVDQFGLSGVGQPFAPSDGSADLADHRIGDLLVVDQGTPAERYYLLGDGRPQQLSTFAALVYDAVGSRAVPVDDVRSAFADPAYPDEWPESLPTAAPDGPVCAVLHPTATDEPHVALAHRPTGGASPSDVEAGTFDVDVEPSGGAYVLSGQSEAGGTPYVVDTKGQKYALIGEEVAGYIGYGQVAPPIVSPAWLAFFDSGVSLSTNAARRVPADAPPESSDEDGTD